MAPPVFNKRGPPPDPPDAGNRVSKTTSTLNRKSGTSITKPRSTPHANVALHKSSILEKNFGTEQFSIDDQADKADMDVEPEELSINTINSDPFEEDFPPLSGISNANVAKSTTESSKINEENRSATLLMDAIKGLLDLTNPYLKKLEEEHPGIGTNFMALLADGASRAMRGERVYTNLSNISSSNPKVSKPSWAEKASAAVNGQNISLKKQTIRASPPRGQSKEDRRVIIRLGPDHEARKTGSFELRQKIQQLIPDKSLIADVWTVPSGVAILAATPAKAATLLQYKEAIENRFGDAIVERQETWTTFVLPSA
ncbi:putative effector protein [Erysiphe necator]|uniref:Putative effector protein n=1 Tax=Uncinula necator TaxID=52586 RepID=A0A0B1P8P6_UNCNE|nr:putative effector protein [Erysiphe necator]